MNFCVLADTLYFICIDKRIGMTNVELNLELYGYMAVYVGYVCPSVPALSVA